MTTFFRRKFLERLREKTSNCDGVISVFYIGRVTRHSVTLSPCHLFLFFLKRRKLQNNLAIFKCKSGNYSVVLKLTRKVKTFYL